MNKEYFLKVDLSLAAQIGWALFWRTNIISFILLLITDVTLAVITKVKNMESISAWNNIYIVLVVGFISITFACYQFFRSSRMGSLKLLILEQAHYQEITSNKFKNESVSKADTDAA